MKHSLLLTTALGALLLTACQNKNEEAASRVDEPYVPLERTDALSGAQSDTFAAYEPAAVTDVSDYDATAADSTAGDEVLSPTDAAGSRTHVVQKGDTLYKLARRFYNDQSRWKDIWEANRTRLSNADKLSVGMKLIIP